MDAHIARLQEIRNEVVARQQNAKAMESTESQQPTNVWDDINEELSSFSDAQKEMLFADADYKQLDMAIAQIAAQYQVQLLMPYVIQDKEGKKLLEKQLLTIRTKKDDIIASEKAEYDEFRRWKEAHKNRE
jgi:hypothetical protein